MKAGNGSGQWPESRCETIRVRAPAFQCLYEENMMRMMIGSMVFILGSLFGGAACVNSSQTGDDAAESADRLSRANDKVGQPPRPPRPPACATNDECVDKCPPDASGCVCLDLPMGGKGCVPTCEADEDCPVAPDNLPPLHCHEGICVPPPPPGAGSCAMPSPPAP